MDKEVIIIGYSDHAYVACDILRAMGKNVVGYCDVEEKTHNPEGLEYMGSESDDKVLDNLQGFECFVAIGNNAVREKICNQLIDHNIALINAVHPSAIISTSAQFGLGVMIGPGSVVNAYAEIQNGVICNSKSVIEHDCVLGSYSHIAPGAILCGGVKISDRTLVGAGAVAKQYIVIGKDVTIGAGTVVVKDVTDGKTVVGNPLREL